MEHPDQRHDEDAVGIYAFRRHYSLSKIGKGLAIFASIAGIVGGCFAWGMQVAGRRIVDTDADFKRQAVYNDSVSLVQRAYLLARVDTLAENVRDLQEQVAVVGLTSCAQLRADAPDWLREKCRDILSRGRPK